MPTNAIFGSAVYGQSRYSVYFLSGNTSVNLTASATGRIGTFIKGSSSVVFSQSGLLKAKARKTGSSSIVFTQIGELKAKGFVQGVSTVSFNVFGTLISTGFVYGQAESLISFNTNAYVQGKVSLFGTTELKFNTYSYLNRFRVQADTILSFEVSIPTIRATSNLPWFPTSNSNQETPYDNNNSLAFFQIYSTTSSPDILPPYDSIDSETFESLYVVTTGSNPSLPYEEVNP